MRRKRAISPTCCTTRARVEPAADAAVRLRRRPQYLNHSEPLEPRRHALLASPDTRRPVASVLAVVERAVEAAKTRTGHLLK